MIDECVTFFLAATQTTSIMVGNALFYLIREPVVREKVLQEVN